jgi:S1-C subfamily serine protease
LTKEERELYFSDPAAPDWCAQLAKPPYRFRLGAELQDAEADTASASATPPKGATIKRIIRGLPADLAGLMKDDVVTAINGQAAADASTALDLIAALPSNRLAQFSIIRNGEQRQVEASPRF